MFNSLINRRYCIDACSAVISLVESQSGKYFLILEYAEDQSYTSAILFVASGTEKNFEFIRVDNLVQWMKENDVVGATAYICNTKKLYELIESLRTNNFNRQNVSDAKQLVVRLFADLGLDSPYFDTPRKLPLFSDLVNFFSKKKVMYSEAVLLNFSGWWLLSSLKNTQNYWEGKKVVTVFSGYLMIICGLFLMQKAYNKSDINPSYTNLLR